MRCAYRSFEHRRRGFSVNLLRLERLEDRLALSHSALPLPYESVALSSSESQFNDRAPTAANVAVIGTYSPRLSTLDGSDFGRFGGGLGAGPNSVLPADFRSSERQISVSASDSIDEGVELVLVVVVEESYANFASAPDARGAVAVHTENSPPPNVTQVIDSRVAHVNESPRPASAENELRPGASPTGVAFNGDSLTRASQVNGAIFSDNRTPASAVATLPQPTAASINASGDSMLARIPAGLIIVPQQSDLSALQLPNARASKSEGDPSKPLGADAVSRDDGSQPSSDKAAISGLESGQLMEGEIANMMAAGSRSALLASLPYQMEAVDQALAAMMNEVQGLGGELITWMDEVSISPWASAATLAGMCGLGARYLKRARGRRSAQEESEDESSSWLFTRLQSPAGGS